jgi:nickel/cobalt transporter (NicO) family protein
MLEGVLFGAIAFGLLHGINPSHGWTLTILYSLKTKKPMLSGIQSSSILAGGHLLSAFVLVVGYVIATTFVKIPHFYFQYGAAVALGILAYIFWKEKEDDFTETQHGHLHDNTELLVHEHTHWHKETGYHSHVHTHQQRKILGLKALAVFALILGFAHEEQFVILALAAGGHNPFVIMIAYVIAVSAAMIGVTMLGIKVFTQLQHRILQYVKYLPKISAIILAGMAVGFAVGIF